MIVNVFWNIQALSGAKQFCFTGLVVSSRDAGREALENKVFNSEEFCPYAEGSRNLVDGLKHSFIHSTNTYWPMTQCSSLFLVMAPAVSKISSCSKGPSLCLDDRPRPRHRGNTSIANSLVSDRTILVYCLNLL